MRMPGAAAGTTTRRIIAVHYSAIHDLWVIIAFDSGTANYILYTSPSIAPGTWTSRVTCSPVITGGGTIAESSDGVLVAMIGDEAGGSPEVVQVYRSTNGTTWAAASTFTAPAFVAGYGALIWAEAYGKFFLANEASLLGARRGHDKVDESDFTDALERIILGAERRVMMDAEDRRRTAYHEAGHAIVGMLTPGADPVRKVSIIPRGQALGVTFAAPENDRFNYLEPEVRAKIAVALGGRGAEEVVFGVVTTGAESDIQHLTGLARHMVGRWGMSDAIGPIAVLPSEADGPLLPGAQAASVSMSLPPRSCRSVQYLSS